MLAFKQNWRDSDKNSKPQKIYSFFPYDRLEISLILQFNCDKCGETKYKYRKIILDCFHKCLEQYNFRIPYNYRTGAH